MSLKFSPRWISGYNVINQGVLFMALKETSFGKAAANFYQDYFMFYFAPGISSRLSITRAIPCGYKRRGYHLQLYNCDEGDLCSG